ncbi:uncharacterized protein SCHCODRAFT_02752799 [Schizophyllum commune H4-8]|uniref:Uncharacterized protein n=1 Tax=Schizophyllum commune (strain H4-8 / FGSC 9210) TaxID=578458 RepID=D8QHU4_SCHCM|nr:uncharacterized protein SCHCODRAFT_02752799 [Schizophyllum commune H4-8]KAI5887337.1 hypothetical protein SCHCODRAFT_02752799 [Schizophyllum commune H4-8]
MPPSGAGGDVESTLSSLTHPPISQLPSVLRSHWKIMIPMLQAFTNTNRVHTEHEDYALWNSVITYLADAFMNRPASVVPQPKLWVLPKDVRILLKSKKQKVALQLTDASLPPALARLESPAGATAANAEEKVSSNATMQPQPESASAPSTSTPRQPGVPPLPSRSALPFKDLESRLRSFHTLFEPPDLSALTDLPVEESDAEEVRGSHIAIPRDEIIVQGDLSELEDSFLDKSTCTTRTEKTKGKKHVVSDFGVVTPLENYPITAEKIAEDCADIRKKLDEASRLPPDAEEFIPQYRCEIDDYDSDEEEYESDSDDDYVPEDTRDTPPAPSHVKLRSQTTTAQNANSTTSGAPPQPHVSHVAAAAPAPMQPDWLASDIGSAGWWHSDKPYAHVCNHKQAFKRLKFLVGFAVAMLWEGKRSASRKLEEEAYRTKTYSRFYKAMRSLMIQALFVLVTEAWNQKKVVCVAMVSDLWSWNVFERIEGREVKDDWLSYTPETAPIRSCYPWSQPFQWGSPESDDAVILMMNEVNSIFPAFPTSLIEPDSGADDSATATNPSEPQAQAQPNPGAAPFGAAQPAQATTSFGEATDQERSEISVDDASLDRAKDRPTTSGPAPKMQLSPLTGPRAPSAAADVTMSDAALSSNAAAAAGPEAPTPAPPRALWRGLRRNDTEDTEPDAPRRPLPIQSNNPNDSGISRPLLHGHRTLATLNALDAININTNDSVGSSTNALAGNDFVQATAAAANSTAAQASGSGTLPTNSGNPRKRSASADSDGEDDDRAPAAKKVKRTPVSTEPSAEAGPGPSTQARRSRAPSKGKKRKLNGVMAQAYALAHPRDANGQFIKKQ